MVAGSPGGGGGGGGRGMLCDKVVSTHYRGQGSGGSHISHNTPCKIQQYTNPKNRGLFCTKILQFKNIACTLKFNYSKSTLLFNSCNLVLVECGKTVYNMVHITLYIINLHKVC